jgi:hopanoid-associated phosphorylase
VTVLAVMGLTREARIIGRAGVRTVCGGGVSAVLEERIERAIAEQRPAGVISTGIAGALDPALRLDDCIIPSAVVTEDGRWDTDPRWTAALRERHADALGDTLYGSDVIVMGAQEKLRLNRDTGAAAVDMESHVAARVAARHGLPFAVMRVVSDTTTHDLAPAVFVCMKPDGGIDLAALSRSILGDPGQIPSLIRTAIEAEGAFRALLRRHDLLGPGAGCPDFGELALDV